MRVSNHAAAGIPIIAGTVQVGETLSVDTSGISDTDGIVNSILTYQWIANDGTEDTAIQDATGSTYTVGADDEDKTIKVRVSFTDDAGNDESLTSEATAAVAARPNSAATGAPTISGTAQVGQMLTASTSNISDSDGLADATFTYQWIANDGTEDTDIQDATGSGVESASLQRYFPATSSQYSLLMPTNRLPSDRSQAGPATQGYWWRIVGPVPLRRSSIRRAKGSPRHGPSTQRTVSCDCLDCQSQYAPPQMSQTGCSVFQRSYALPIDTHGIIRFSMSSTSLVES